uniref:Terpene_synth_C domain-containing protein n=1 Tax=Heterorhabditis bacteriophora TaxID=37862 RepID=A0A1I7X3N0_HETBA
MGMITIVQEFKNFESVDPMASIFRVARDLSVDAFEKILEFRNRVQDTLYIIVKEARLSPQPAICFGHILLSLPIVTVSEDYKLNVLYVSTKLLCLYNDRI